MTGPYVDAEAAVKAWVNTLTADLVGDDNPLTLGAHLHRLRSPYKGCYVRLLLIGGTPELTPERPMHRARISGQIYGLTKEATAVAAVAYANAVASLAGIPAVMGSASCLCAADITGPLDATAGDEPMYLVDADFYLRPAA
ncbi:MAG: hypothetical protein ACRDUA_23395 [Micromonosporaceae bacterium]